MGKKKKVEVGTFTIVSKYPKGKKSNTIYTVTYQRSGKPKMYDVKMIWLDFREDNHTWAFMDGKEAQLLSNEERKEFIAEMFKFEKGGSYRKTHPIMYSKAEEIRKRIKELEYDIYLLKEEADKSENAHYEELARKYEKKIDHKKLNKFDEDFRKLCEKSGYILKTKYFMHGTDIMVYDKSLDIPVGRIKNTRNVYCVEELDEYEIKNTIKENQIVRNMLEE